MTLEQTLILLKPDALEKGVEIDILDRIRTQCFSFPVMYKTNASEYLLKEHYASVAERHGEKKFGWTVKTMMSGPLIAAIAEGENAVGSVREIAGTSFDPKICRPGTIRGDYSIDSAEAANREERGIYNLIHTSDSKDSAEKEIGLWFRKYLPDYLKDKKKDDYLFWNIAETMDFPYPDLIRSTAETSNKRKFLFNGIKKPEYAREVEQEGVKLISRSWHQWDVGIRVFHPAIDSALFDDSGGLDITNKSFTELDIAITNYDLLAKQNLSISGYMADVPVYAYQIIPYQDLALMRVKIKHLSGKDNVQIRKYRQIAERKMLQLIDCQIFSGFTPGKTIMYEEDIR
jgi:nucleoside-diphosphate kinase